MVEVNGVVGLIFSGLLPLVIEGVAVESERVVVRARTASRPAVCSRCGTELGRVHSCHDRTVADLPLDGRLVLRVRVRRLVCSTPQCCKTFR
ncbi:transposase family protein [Nocardia sp. NPDC059246]|uniref:transposase family protein n=1 Tax=unclassified Nocardia TaxID=2637762 RepID=UPI003687692F